MQIAAVAITVFTLGFGLPYALTLVDTWKAKHTHIQGHRLKFTGSGTNLLGRWIGWYLLTFATLGIYFFWVVPKLARWRTESLALEFQPR